MMLGAHVSAAGGVDKIFARGRDIGAECLQLFTRAPSQWRATPLSKETVNKFIEARAAHGNRPVFAHDIYLTNLAAADPDIRQRSLASLIDEIQRCRTLGLDGLVCHMGSHSQEEVGLCLLAEGLVKALDETEKSPVPILLETTAGQGANLGSRFEHLQFCLIHSAHHPRLRVCLDTCHVTAAGYDLRTPAAVATTLEEFDRVIGLDRLLLLHLNDSKKDMGSRVDRHHHIGRGFIGTEGFRALLHHPRLAHLPMVLETPEMDSMHAVNLALLKELRDLPPTHPGDPCAGGGPAGATLTESEA